MPALLLVITLLAAAQTTDPPDTTVPKLIIRQLLQAHFGVAEEYADRRLAADPSDPTAQGLKGTVLSFRGRYGEALPLLEASVGTDFYENFGLRHHANALRASGAYAEAAALREQRLLNGTLSEQHYYTDLQDLSEDYRQQGDLERAQDYAEQALGMFPDRPTSYASLAELAMDRGDLGAADELLWLGRWYGMDSVTQQLVAEARLMRLRGSPQGALNLLLPWRRKLPRDMPFWITLAECHIAVGDLAAAEHILYGMIRFKEHAFPEQIAARARLKVAQGDRAAAEALLLDGLADLPANRALRSAAAELGIP